MRIARQVRDGETAVNMFAGVGCFSTINSKHSEARKVYSIDANPWAEKYVHENVKLNRAYGIIVPLLGDAKDHAETVYVT